MNDRSQTILTLRPKGLDSPPSWEEASREDTTERNRDREAYVLKLERSYQGYTGARLNGGTKDGKLYVEKRCPGARFFRWTENLQRAKKWSTPREALAELAKRLGTEHHRRLPMTVIVMRVVLNEGTSLVDVASLRPGDLFAYPLYPTRDGDPYVRKQGVIYQVMENNRRSSDTRIRVLRLIGLRDGGVLQLGRVAFFTPGAEVVPWEVVTETVEPGDER